MFPVNGPQFLIIYLLLFGAVGLSYWGLRHLALRRAARRAAAASIPFESLTPQRVGYLLDGKRRAGAVHHLLARKNKRVAVEESDALLSRHGLILSTFERAGLRLWASAMFGGLLAAGIARIVVGLSRGKPVGFLILLVIVVGGYLAYVLTVTAAARTSAGEELVARLRSRYRSGIGDVSPAMGYALLGWIALRDTPVLQAALIDGGYATVGGGGAAAGSDGYAGGSGCSSGGHTGCSGGGGGCGGCGGGGGT